MFLLPARALEDSANQNELAPLFPNVSGYFTECEKNIECEMIFIWLAGLFGPSRKFVLEVYKSFTIGDNMKIVPTEQGNPTKVSPVSSFPVSKSLNFDDRTALTIVPDEQLCSA